MLKKPKNENLKVYYQASSLQKQLSTSTSNLDHSNQTSEQRYNNSNQMISNQSEQRYSGNHVTTSQSEQRYPSSAWDKYGEFMFRFRK